MDVRTDRSEAGDPTTTAPPGPRRRPPTAGRLLSSVAAAVSIAVAAATLALPSPTVSAEDVSSTSAVNALASDRVFVAPMAGYQLADAFGSVPGVTQVDPVGIADDGTIAGNYVYQGVPKAFRARPGQPFEALEVGGSLDRVTVAGIAPNGTIAAVASNSQSTQEGSWLGTWVPDEEGNLGDFTRLVQNTNSGLALSPRAVNSRGDVLLQTAVVHADGSRTALGNPRPEEVGVNLSPDAITETGEVVGTIHWVEPHGNETRAVKWVGGAPTELNVFGDVQSEGMAIADDGTIAMHVALEENAPFSTYLVNPSTGRKDLVAGPDQRVSIFDINPSGVAVGAVDLENGGAAAVAYEGGKLRRLDRLVAEPTVRLQVARGINADGVITGDVDWQGAASAFLARPVNPVVFVHGAGASRISQVAGSPTPDRGDEGAQQWLACGEDRMHLSLWPDDLENGRGMDDLRAFAPLRDEKCFGLGSGASKSLVIYDDLLSHLEMTGFRPYRVEGRLQRFTADGCDTSQEGSNLFTFAYDWRKDNRDSALQLADFMGCIRKLWPDREVNIITHSMGSLVAQRYLLDQGDDAPVERLITFGAPWLGATKLVNVLYTGEFLKWPANGSNEAVRHIAGSFTAAHQLMAGPYYEQLATEPVLLEAGTDLNGDGQNWQRYTFQRMKALLDKDNPVFLPGTTAESFQIQPNQADWSQLRTDVDITHFVGLQAGRNTIGTVVARNRVVCGLFSGCTDRDVIEQELVCGDGTVPLVSATRVGRGRDLNAPDAEVRVLQAGSTADNDATEHTGLTGNRDALARLDQLLTTPSAKDMPGGIYTGPIGTENQDLDSCTGSSPGLASAAAPDEAHSFRYVRMLGGTDVTISDDRNHVTPPTETKAEVPGVTQYASNVEDGSMAAVPMSSERTYRVAFRATGEPLELELLDGTQQSPSRAVRWTDADVPEGPAELELMPNRTPVLRVDRDGDGEVDSPVSPSVDVTGAQAADVTAPQLTVTAIGAGAQRRYALSVTDDGPGSVDVQVSTGGDFTTYDGPFAAPAGATTLRAFATDASGNRSSMVEMALDAVPTTPLTTATRDPAASDRGWNSGPVDVQLSAEAAGGVRSVTWWAEGATSIPATTVDGAQASARISAPGVTQLHFQATANDGTLEPVRTLPVRIDIDEPAVALRTPYPDSTVADLASIAGTASDMTSGTGAVDIELTDVDGRSWNGERWTDGATWLPAKMAASTPGATTFERRTGNPAGDDLRQGTYRIRVRVTDNSGRRTTTEVARVTVAHDAAWMAIELQPDGGAKQSSARLITDRGVAVGRVDNTRDVIWQHGSVTTPPVGDGRITALGLDGTMAGSVPVPGTTNSVPVVWTPDGGRTELPLLPGHGTGGVSDRNESGLAVGTSGSGATSVAVRWDDQGVRRLPLPLAGYLSSVNDVNGSGTAVGSFESPDIFDNVPERALMWAPDGTVRHLGTLGGPDRAPSAATAVNDLGVAVGWAWTDVEIAGTRHAVAFVDGKVLEVDRNLFTKTAEATDVNDRGWIVGNYITRTDGLQRAFLSTDLESAVDLNSLLPEGSGWVLQRAYGINELGQIIGTGTLNGADRGFVLSTVHAPVAEDVEATAAGETRIQLDGWDADITEELTHHLVDGPAHGTADLLDDGVVRYRPAKGYIGVDSFSYRVDDGRFESNVARVRITVTEPEDPEDPGDPEPVNQVPVAAIDGPRAATEGTTVAFDSSRSHDPDGDDLVVAWDTDADGLFDDGNGTTVQLSVPDNGPRTVSLRVTDPDGAFSVASTVIEVANLDPQIQGLPASVDVAAGSALELSGTVADVPADTHTATLDPGDGSAALPVAVDQGKFTLRHSFATAGTRTVTLTVVDDDGGRATATVVVNVKAAERVLSPATITLIGSVSVPSSKKGKTDTVAFAGVVVSSTTSATGIIGIARSGSTAMALGSVKVTKAGTWTEGGVRYGTVIGTGVLGSGRTARTVSYELTMADTRTDRIWLTVKDQAGNVVPELTFGGTPPAGGLNLALGAASVAPR